MSERNPFQQNQTGPLQCEEWEALLVDALDGTLKAEDKAVFTSHGSECPMCAEMLAQAKQGQEWMTYLHEEPSVPGDLVSKILGRTSGASLPQLAVAGPAQPVAVPVAHFTTRRTFRDARMLMTAAMAFFSLALSLSLFGVRLDTLRLADLKPSALQTTIARQFYGAKKQMVSYYENIRLVYEVESKMRELRRDSETDQNTQPRKDEKQPGNPPGDGHKTGGKLTTPNHPGMPGPVVAGPPVLADLDQTETEKAQNLRKEEVVEVNELVVKRTADQAERSLA
ncbi:zf-HC2 domain-containing protein [Alloacidobacterium dinghuense]|uniref:Zf-HC2 domain-containing protein n=1 Tax=Alloacidobacterium dinghuense TaxID=2763107 RepID=A0A7G8BEW2_9BACT|nr:zf-HC2 domain-containing protein [Alloacidobacterium dinghuense]QNI31082.1 zf-HC2 domain-containing protein [Alloacidobacterium dinghuense]